MKSFPVHVYRVPSLVPVSYETKFPEQELKKPTFPVRPTDLIVIEDVGYSYVRTKREINVFEGNLCYAALDYGVDMFEKSDAMMHGDSTQAWNTIWHTNNSFRRMLEMVSRLDNLTPMHIMAYCIMKATRARFTRSKHRALADECLATLKRNIEEDKFISYRQLRDKLYQLGSLNAYEESVTINPDDQEGVRTIYSVYQGIIDYDSEASLKLLDTIRSKINFSTILEEMGC